MDMFHHQLQNTHDRACVHGSRVIQHWVKENAIYVKRLLPSQDALICSAMNVEGRDVLRDPGKTKKVC